MKFLVDAQLPRRLSEQLQSIGHDSLHTLDLPDANQTSDDDLNRISVTEKRTLVTKDADFIDSLFQRGEPHKLLLIATGNIRNADLLALFANNIVSIVAMLNDSRYVELNRADIVDHG